MATKKEVIEKKLEGRKLAPIQEKKEVKYKLKLDAQQYEEVRKAIHTNFVGGVTDPLFEKLGMEEKTGTLDISSKDYMDFKIWLDLNNVGRIRIPILHILRKFEVEE